MRILCAVIILFVAAPHLHSQTTDRSHPAPGRLVDIGGRKLHLDCSGSGSPTIIFEAGGDAYAIDWALVQPRIAQQTRVCSYDRAGLGWSDPGPADEIVEQTTADLHSLLLAAKEKGPYIFVGASVGGAFIRAYQRTFPKEVAALVFTNSSNHIGISVKGKIGLIWDLTEEEIRSGYPLPASAKGPEPTHEGEPFTRLPPNLQQERLWLDKKHWESFTPANAGPEATLSWHREFLREFDEAKNTTSPVLGSLPVIVVSSNPVLGKSDCLSHSTAAACLDFLSSNTVHITATGSGHEIHLYQPDTLLKALSQAVAAVRSGLPLAMSSAYTIQSGLGRTSTATGRPRSTACNADLKLASSTDLQNTYKSSTSIGRQECDPDSIAM
jgi:pimeloyl-ACP methyl ester carboxylesterase